MTADLLRDALSALCFGLTGKYPSILPETHIHELLGGNEFCLPDGGYSRLVVSELTGQARLTSNSRPAVKAAWERCAGLIADVETEVARARHAFGADT